MTGMDPSEKAGNRPFFAWMYARDSERSERSGEAEHRAEMLAGLSGRVVEVGAGNGMNFRHYPPGVAEVVAVEPEKHLRAIAEREAQRAPGRHHGPRRDRRGLARPGRGLRRCGRLAGVVLGDQPGRGSG